MVALTRRPLGCQRLHTTAHTPSKAVFFKLFREYGLPAIIRTDNGVPFATTALGRVPRLAVWWIRLGIYPELIEPAHPRAKREPRDSLGWKQRTRVSPMFPD
jgi:putative transposase